MIEIRILGRGGSGIVSLARMFGEIATLSGYEATVIPRFGAERRGAPIYTDIRLSKKGIIKLKSFVTKADITFVVDYKAFSPKAIISMTKEKGTIFFAIKESKKQAQRFQGYKLIFLAIEDESIEGRGQMILNLRILGVMASLIRVRDESLLINCVKLHLPQIEEETIRNNLIQGLQSGVDLDVV